ncbi:hypothetical protein PQX77_015424 [Marasmius sp. AFHP31]|nr:hypothetical protein PQX77_015424 [Marasmius sp. AFHP31]
MSGLNIDTVPAKLHYFFPPADGSKPYNYVVEPPAGVPRLNYTTKEYVLQIENVRGKEDSVSLDKSGFYFGKHPVSHTSFANDEEIKKEYYPESIELLKKLTRASKIVLFDHTVQRREAGDTPIVETNKRMPVPRVHVDQTPKAAHNRVQRHVPEEEAESLLKRRFQIINLWCPISHPALDWPLAFYGETFTVKYNPEHKWKYVRGLMPEEIILIKCYDPIEDGSVAVLTPHTAFEDPTTPADTLPRQSIELRALVFYDD